MNIYEICCKGKSVSIVVAQMLDVSRNEFEFVTDGKLVAKFNKEFVSSIKLIEQEQ